ncbi:hypothetical protein BK133_28000 [Paenibacillus sp. FSL H8-0548]|uniref:DeoR/GlpR family DNA-binding transcription regulator n=1 Tax=Paenibacillus sp. FSL H8-0548 TaxID=1920422 RepID=UPI00096D8C47|nr:DeoR/GlpR family DNA-binding transcription regulator [Paenibacillus sp. FSL H8-0548]OMF21640.1 hypothetical protein BK133_28000 [Paenibacillus sp. FSL H8-0548]
MLASERHKLILLELEERGNISVKELKAKLEVSLDTVRRDLEYLEKIDKIRRVHGGAVAIEDTATNQTFMRRKVTFLERKQELASCAMSFVRENMALSLNAGTTNIEVAKQLAQQFERLTIITNSIKVAEALASKRNFTVIMPGGVLNHDEFSLYGNSFELEIAKFNIDAAFIAINAISLDKGLTDFRQGEIEIINAMINNASYKIVVADSSKFETVSYINICGLDQIDAIVTDTALDQSLLERYSAQNIRIVQQI